MITSTKPALAEQIRALLGQATPEVVPGRVLAWWGNTDFPTGAAGDLPLTQQQWQGLYFLLENAALELGPVKPLPLIDAATRDMRPDDPLPIAIASFRVAVPRASLMQSVLDGALNGGPPRSLPTRLADAIEERHAFMATAYMHGQWARDIPVHRGRHVRLLLDERFHFTNPGAPLPDSIAVDFGDGFVDAAFGTVLDAHYPTGDSAEIAVRCTYGTETLEARLTLALSDDPAPPRPDDTWPLQAEGPDTKPGEQGTAWVFRVPGRREVVNPVILVEGFPGGHPCDYLYELLNASGLLDALRAAGYDVIIVGLANGLAPIQSNAPVLVDCIRKALARTSQPLVVGGVSMGGLVSRYALAWMETEGEDHGTSTYLSIDAPHRGTYTSLGVQWFVHALEPYARGLMGFSRLLDSDANVQLMIEWLHEGEVVRSPLRDELLADFEKVGGYPRTPRKLAVSCGRGDGVGGSAKAGTAVMTWARKPFLSMTINTLPGAAGVVAEGSWFMAASPLAPLPDPAIRAWETMPGSQNAYNEQVVQVASAFGCGTVQPEPANLQTCCIPTVSALDLDQDPSAPVGPGTGPFDAHTCSPGSLQHLELAPEVTRWIVAQLGTPPPVGGGGSHAGAQPTVAAAPFNPMDPAFFQNPYPKYAYMREHAPVVPVGPDLWFFLHADCKAILDQTETFLKHPPGPQTLTGIFMSDPPRHTRLRELIGPALCTAIQGAPALIEQRVTGTIGTVAPTGHMEAVGDYAGPVASGVLYDIVGIPDADRPKVWAWELAILRARGSTQPAIKLQSDTATAALQFYLEGRVHEYQRTGAGSGLLGLLCRQIGLGLVVEDVYLSCADFIAAGHLSNTWLIASAILALLQRPDQLCALRLAPAKIDQAVVELLRYEPPFQLVARYAAYATQIGATEIAAGQRVVGVVGSANRDATVFAGDPEILDMDRADAGEQLGFGDGIHQCIGAPLARMVVPAALLALVQRLPGLALDGLPQWQTADPTLRALTSLPLRFAA
jgi:cytochrome P450